MNTIFLPSDWQKGLRQKRANVGEGVGNCVLSYTASRSVQAATLEGDWGISFKIENVLRLLGSTKLLVYLLGKHFHTRRLTATTSHLKIRNNLNVHHRKINNCKHCSMFILKKKKPTMQQLRKSSYFCIN